MDWIKLADRMPKCPPIFSGYFYEPGTICSPTDQAGHRPIVNNPIENAIHPIALGKKNWLIAGSERA